MMQLQTVMRMNITLSNSGMLKNVVHENSLEACLNVRWLTDLNQGHYSKARRRGRGIIGKSNQSLDA
ncbi:hypothetical protein D8Y20_10870 [Mariprofundus sp. EBB-1]|uniref:hypothetical protein n=1 Tax=Mariprofundus sp. EBB-1 TaxID=2650971 RepID=UPI000EF17A60|nr:hypothetical protein [Mariprofundus sp. EBB-1]RLL50884.1 hypothetical protein D8Y20_10870 [Mariprofundus sp. EBB-1]